MLLAGSNTRPLTQEPFRSRAAARRRVNRGRTRAAAPRHYVSWTPCPRNCTGFPPRKRARLQRNPRAARVTGLVPVAQARDLRRYTPNPARMLPPFQWGSQLQRPLVVARDRPSAKGGAVGVLPHGPCFVAVLRRVLEQSARVSIHGSRGLESRYGRCFPCFALAGRNSPRNMRALESLPEAPESREDFQLSIFVGRLEGQIAHLFL